LPDAVRDGDLCTNGTGHTRVWQRAFLLAVHILGYFGAMIGFAACFFFATIGSAILKSQSQ
jgi:hypothetical protein